MIGKRWLTVSST